MKKTTITHPDARRVDSVRHRATSLRAEPVDASLAQSGDRRRRTFVPLDNAPLLVTGRPSSRLPTRRALALALVGAVIVALSAVTAPAKRTETTTSTRRAAPAERRVDLFAAWDDSFESSEPAAAAETNAVPADPATVDTHRLVLVAGPETGAAIPPEPGR